MLKATLRYTLLAGDGKIVNCILANHNVEIIKTEPGRNHYPEITINIANYTELNRLLFDLNSKCNDEVRVVIVLKDDGDDKDDKDDKDDEDDEDDEDDHSFREIVVDNLFTFGTVLIIAVITCLIAAAIAYAIAYILF